MTQIANIFRKDLRRYWRESAVCIVFLVAYAWNDMRGWAAERDLATGSLRAIVDYRFLLGLLSVLLPGAWWFLITRVIQAESLAGDKQFWVTRPYEWKKLLAAKMLFLAGIINLPLLIVDVVLLAAAGFAPVHYVVGLLWMQLMVAAVIILPVLTLATVTATVVQMILTVLGIVLYLILVSALSSQIPSSGFAGSADSLQFILFIVTGLAVILCQYSRRRTSTSRWLIVAIALVVVLVVVATPYDAIVRRDFPTLTQGGRPPLQLTLLPPENEWRPAPSGEDGEKQATMLIPLAVSGIDEGSIVSVNAYRVSIETANGLRWHSGWESQGQTLFPDNKKTNVGFLLKKPIFEQMKPGPVTLRIQVALSAYRDANQRQFVVPQGEFLLSALGFCSAKLSFTRELRCRAPLRAPSSLLITSDLSETTCSAFGKESKATTRDIARYWHQSDAGPAEFGISPITTLNIYLSAQHETPGATISGICPGTPLTISSPEFSRAVRMELEFSTSVSETIVSDNHKATVLGLDLS